MKVKVAEDLELGVDEADLVKTDGELIVTDYKTGRAPSPIPSASC